jgi:protoporphyrinogen oxidase
MALAAGEHIGIIGAGPSGLAVSLFLNQPCDIFERENHVGGHAASFIQDGFTFDYGPHILFSRDKEILDFIVASLVENVSKCRRNNKIFFKDRLVKYPFENDLHSLPLEDNYACLKGFIFNPYKEQYAVPGNMKEWLLKQFGEGICARYLFPYNEKVWNIPVEQLSMAWADRIPNPPAEDILKSSLGYSTEGYLHQLYYFYPQVGGYQAISEAWKTAATIQFNASIKQISWMPAGKIQLLDENGRQHEYKQIISTMPVHELIHCLDREIPQDILDAIDRLIVNPMYVVSFGIRGVDQNQYTAVYFPDADFLVNRISYPCTFSAKNGPAGHWSLQAEITCAKTATAWFQTDDEILHHTKEGLQKRGLLPADEDIVLQRVDRKEQSYVVYDVGYEACADKVRQWFASIGIQLLGRFSYFEYVNVDMAVSRAVEIAMNLNGETGDPAQAKSRYLARALATLGYEPAAVS